jgi:hypothetical protein
MALQDAGRLSLLVRLESRPAAGFAKAGQVIARHRLDVNGMDLSGKL